MPYNFVADGFQTKKLCSGLFSSEMRFYTENGRFAVFIPFLAGLGTTYDVHLRLIGKRVVYFLLRPFHGTFLLHVTSEALRAKID